MLSVPTVAVPRISIIDHFIRARDAGLANRSGLPRAWAMGESLAALGEHGLPSPATWESGRFRPQIAVGGLCLA